MQAAYAAGDYVRYGQLMQELKGVLGAGDAGKGGAGP